MSETVRTITGYLKLDKSQYSRALREVAAEARVEAAKLQAAMSSPFAPAATAVKMLTSATTELATITRVTALATRAVGSAYERGSSAAAAFTVANERLANSMALVRSAATARGPGPRALPGPVGGPGVHQGRGGGNGGGDVIDAEWSPVPSGPRGISAGRAPLMLPDYTKSAAGAAQTVSWIERLIGSMGRLQSFTQPLAMMPGTFGSIAGRVSSLAGMVSSLAGQFSGLGGAGTGALSSIAAAAGPLAPVLGVVAAAAAAVALPLIGLGIAHAALNSESVRLAASLESTSIAFGTQIGSAKLATRMIAELKQVSKDTPLEFSQIAPTARMLMNAGVAASQTKRELLMLGDVATGAQTDLSGMTMIYTQIANKGRADTMDLMQLANRGIPIYAALTAALKISREELNHMLVNGKVGFTEIQAAFRQMTDLGGKYHNAMKNSSGPLQQLQNAADETWEAMKVGIGQVLIDGLGLKDYLKDTTAFVERMTPAVVGFFSAAAAQAKPFIELLASTMNWIRAGAEMWGEYKGAFESAFGEGSLGKVAGLMKWLNPAFLTIKAIGGLLDMIAVGLRGLASVFRGIKEAIDTIHVWWSGENGKPITQADIDAEVKKRDEKRQEDEKWNKSNLPEGTDNKAQEETAKAQEAQEKAQKDADESARRVRELQRDSLIAQLRAAGREAEAAQLDLARKWEERFTKATTLSEGMQVATSFAIERAILVQKQQADATKAQEEAAGRVHTAEVEARIAKLKAAGADMEAELLSLWESFKKDEAGAPAAAHGAILQKYLTDKQAVQDRYAERQAAADQREAQDAASDLAQEMEEGERIREEQRRRTQQLAQNIGGNLGGLAGSLGSLGARDRFASYDALGRATANLRPIASTVDGYLPSGSDAADPAVKQAENSASILKALESLNGRVQRIEIATNGPVRAIEQNTRKQFKVGKL